METKMIGKKITDARKKMNLSQAQLAERIFISAQAVGKWERGESIPDIITFNRLAQILGVDLNYFSEDFQSTANVTSSIARVSEQTQRPNDEHENKLSWDMSRGNWVDADFSGLTNLHDKFGSSNMQRCLFIGSNMSGLLLKGNYIDACDFSDSDLSGGQIKSTHLSSNRFVGCTLKETEFTLSYIKGCDFSGADFSGVKVGSGAFVKNKISDVIWKHTSFKESHIADIVFEGIIEDCYFENCSFTKVKFQNSKLINTFFKNKSLKQIRFIDCQADRLTYAFLKNGKADLSGISLVTP